VKKVWLTELPCHEYRGGFQATVSGEAFGPDQPLFACTNCIRPEREEACLQQLILKSIVVLKPAMT
jgi:hypothetical protein